MHSNFAARQYCISSQFFLDFFLFFFIEKIFKFIASDVKLDLMMLLKLCRFFLLLLLFLYFFFFFFFVFAFVLALLIEFTQNWSNLKAVLIEFFFFSFIFFCVNLKSDTAEKKIFTLNNRFLQSNYLENISSSSFDNYDKVL